MLDRDELTATITRSIKQFPVVALVGPRQCGKTTIARTLVPPGGPNYFDLERSIDVRRVEDPMLAFAPLKGLVVIDEVQHAPEIFKVLRVMADERPRRRRFLVLGSASPALLKQTSESLAGRICVVEMAGFTLTECGADIDRRWHRGGMPRAWLARTDAEAMTWLREFVDTIAQRDVPAFDSRIPALQIHRLLSMLAHYHGQTLNASAIAASLGVSPPSVRRYADLLTDMFHIRQLQPWHENLSKRQVKAPKLLIRDTGVLHHLLGAQSRAQLLRDPRLGASWEGLVIEELLARAKHESAYWWATHQGAELDLMLFSKGLRFGVEVKRSDAPGMTRSIATALSDLKLERVTIVAPVAHAYDVAERVGVVPFADVIRDPDLVVAAQPRKRPARRK